MIRNHDLRVLRQRNHLGRVEMLNVAVDGLEVLPDHRQHPSARIHRPVDGDEDPAFLQIRLHQSRVPFKVQDHPGSPAMLFAKSYPLSIPTPDYLSIRVGPYISQTSATSSSAAPSQPLPSVQLHLYDDLCQASVEDFLRVVIVG